MSGFEWIVPIVTAAISGAGSLYGASQQNQANSAQAQRQMDFQWGNTEFQAAFAREMAHRQELNNMEYWIKGGERDANNVLNAQNFQNAMVQNSMNYNTQMVAGQENFQREMLARQTQINRENTSAAQLYNAMEAQKARDQTLYMSDTAYQRAMNDMRRAGLNPLLAYQQGGASSPASSGASVAPLSAGLPSGASLPGATAPGAMAHAPAPPRLSTGSVGAQPGSKAQMENVMGPALSNAAQVFRTMADAQEVASRIDVQQQQALNLVAQTENTRTHSAFLKAQTETEGARPANVRAQTALTGAQTQTERAMPGLRGAQTAEAHSSAARAAAQADRERQEIQQTNDYGRPTPLGGIINLGERLGGRILEGARQALTPNSQAQTPGTPRNTGALEGAMRWLGRQFR